MKKALHQFIGNKSNSYSTVDYDDYRRNLWYSTNDRPLVFGES